MLEVELSSMDTNSKNAHVTQLILATLDLLLGCGNYEQSVSFMDMGIDSSMAISFQKGIQSVIGSATKITTSVMFDYPTVASLTEYILESLDPTRGS